MAINFTPAKLAGLPMMTEGGEAKILEYQTDSLIKAFKPHVDIGRKEKKVTKFVNAHLPAGVIGPQEIVTVNKKFAGYVMKRVRDADVFRQLTKPAHLKIAKFSNRDVLEIVLKAGNTLNVLHKGGVVVGDISDYNILTKRKDIFFIDVDSWGVGGMFPPDAYTEIFSAPECYKSGDKIEQSVGTDLFSFAVLSFNLLTRIHPFNGTYEKDQTMSTLDRIKRKLSVLGKHPIIIPKMIPSWKWMSPDLENAFLSIFEKGQRVEIVDVMEDQLQHSKLCSVHNVFYYSKYSECPICSGKAKIVATPVVVKVVHTAGPKVVIIFESTDVKILLSRRHYLSNRDEVVHIQSNAKVTMENGERVDFSYDGSIAFFTKEESIRILDPNNKNHSVINRMFKTPYVVKQNDLYYVDKGGMLTRITVTNKGNIRNDICQVYNPLFAVSENGETFIGSFYPKKAVIKANNYNFELPYKGKVKEYAIKYDVISKKWLFVYLLPSGKYRTLVFGGRSIEYDSDVISYNASPLSGICFHNNTIYDPADGKIVGINYVKNQAKEFSCDVVSENSALEFENGKFIITTEEKVYTFGN